jgi:tol-pal system protein YbgF
MRRSSIFMGLVAMPLFASSAGALDLPFGLSIGGREEPPVVMAQAGDPRMAELQELVRQLNGRVEELNFQILQMQDQIRRMQEDTEFRFQQLEGGAPGAANPDRQGALTPPPASQDTAAAEDPSTQPPVSGALIPPPAPSGTVPPAPSGDLSGTTFGAPPRDLGSITFDQNGNPTGGGIATESLPGVEQVAPPPGDVVAALPAGGAEELYRTSYEFILSGDYATAEAGFRDHIEQYPQDPKAADARYWLGEALLAQDRYRDAAEVFLEANQSFPESRKAPDMMLKLGISLAALSQRDVACATYGEIAKRYPQASEALKARVAQEQALAGC